MISIGLSSGGIHGRCPGCGSALRCDGFGSADEDWDADVPDFDATFVFSNSPGFVNIKATTSVFACSPD